MLNVTIKPPFERVGKAFQLMKMGKALQDGVEMLGFQIEREAKIETPIDTGRLRSSITTDIGTLQARIAPHTVYAGWIHEGKMQRLGKMVYIKGQGRAGTPPGGKPFMEMGAKKAKSDLAESTIIKHLTIEIEKAIKGI